MGAILFLIIGLSIQMEAWAAGIYWTCFGLYLVFHMVRLCAIYEPKYVRKWDK